MDIKQAIESINIGMINYTTHGGWRFSSINWVALDVALSALRAEQERDNPKPLSLAKLKEFIGKPIFIDGINKWGILSGRIIDIDDGENEFRFTVGFDYGWEWLDDVARGRKIYDHEPGGEKG